jgi:Asp-tRNA(Asn)/Glu-tRNA(Gln) amidotransferase A subunit family amidase
MIETTGWAKASTVAKEKIAAARAVLAASGIEVVDRHTSSVVTDVEAALADAMTITRLINAWESIWPLKAYRASDASKLSKTMLDRLAEAEAMSIDEYRQALQQRVAARARYAKLKGECDAAITLTAPDVAPVGLAATGDPVFVVPATMLGVPAISIPAMGLGGLPLGLQTIGFQDEDADLFAVTASIAAVLDKERKSLGGSQS